MAPNSRNNQVAILGEVLFDCFPDGKRILGGAPFNVAWNLQGFGTNSLFLSSIGNDSDGKEILDRMERWNISRSGVSVSNSLPTGTVSVSIGEDGEPRYEINSDVAYDQFSSERCEQELRRHPPRIFYNGSLSFRTQENRKCLASLRVNHNLHRFVDLNLREPWVDRDWLPLIIGDCQWLKLNADELSWLAKTSIDPTSEVSIRAAIKAIDTATPFAKPGIYLVTCGESGAWWIDDEVCIHKPAVKINNFVDSVGAGDAFTAATIHGIIEGHSPGELLELAVRFAAKTCSLQGATTDEESHYQLR